MTVMFVAGFVLKIILTSFEKAVNSGDFRLPNQYREQL